MPSSPLKVPLGKILVIDDSPTILKVVELVLTKAGYLVSTSGDGEDGLERAKSFKPDLILLDFVMPRMNGYQVCRALSESEDLKHVPVVLLSAKGEQVGEQFVKVMGIVDYITKPFRPTQCSAWSSTFSRRTKSGRSCRPPRRFRARSPAA